MEVSVAFQMYARQNGMQNQRCVVCEGVHQVASLPDGRVSVALMVPGILIARLSAVYDNAEYKPYRTGPYRVWFVGAVDASRRLVNWDGTDWTNGPIRFADNAIAAWQGLGGDMEHTKKMPYEFDAPFPMLPELSCD